MPFLTDKAFKTMSTNDIEVQNKAQSASAEQEVQNKVSTASEIQSEDLLEVLEAKDAELVKIREEKENYKRGLLKAKGKLDEDDDSDSPDIDTLIDRKVNEKFLASKETQLLKEKDEAIKALAKRNRELETTLKNRSQISTGVSQGTSEENVVKVSDNILSAEQIKSLKAKGWNDDKIELFKKNLQKNK